MNKMAKRAVVLAIMLAALIVLPVAAMAEVVQVSNAEEFKTQMNRINGMKENLTIELKNDIDIKNSWEHYHWTCDADLTIDGKGHTLTNLNLPLIYETGSGHNLVIKNLTIDQSTIKSERKSCNDEGVAAFVGYAGTSRSITLTNCHLKNSKVEGRKWNGGMIGYAAGYSNLNNGPVFEKVTIKDCSVTNSTITGEACGGIIGHATGDAGTYVEIVDCTVTGNTIKGTDDVTNKAGDLIGTVGVAGKTHGDANHAYGVQTGGVVVDGFIAKDNKVTSNGVEVKRIFGRFGSKGTLTIAGDSVYDEGDIDNGWDASKDSGEMKIAQNATITKPTPKPTPTPTPTATPVPDTSNMPQTGDNSNLALFALLLTASAAGMMLLMRRKAAQE